MTALEKISGNSGFKVISGTVTNQSFEVLVVNDDAVFTTFKIDGIDCLTSSGIESNTIKAGAYLSAPAGSKITDVTISSGLVIGY